MADLNISFKIPSAKVDEYVAHYCFKFPNIKLKDAKDLDSGLKYTDKQWVKKHIIQTVCSNIVRGRNIKYHKDITAYKVDDIE